MTNRHAKAGEKVSENNVKAARVVNVIQIKSTRGNGTSADPIRLVTQYWTSDGQFIGEITEASDYA